MMMVMICCYRVIAGWLLLPLYYYCGEYYGFIDMFIIVDILMAQLLCKEQAYQCAKCFTNPCANHEPNQLSDTYSVAEAIIYSEPHAINPADITPHAYVQTSVQKCVVICRST